tara:strand:- start:192 stop:617 length:426 start_codon:yes stop_codon:yes gene_type:complete
MKWVICFCESENIGMWKTFTKKRHGFSHVFAVNYDAKLKLWKKIEFTTTGFNIEILKGKKANELVLFMFMCCKCIEYEPANNPIYVPRLMYCVSFIKHLCGISKFWLLTPYQLYCELLKRKGKVIFDSKDLEEPIYGNENA